MRLSVCTPIDRLLGGGVEDGCVTNFFGPPAVGKSQISMLSAVSAVGRGKKVLFIDTEGGFSVERLNQIADGGKVGKKIILLEPKTWEEQMEAVKKAEVISRKRDIGLIIVDSIAALWRVHIEEKNAKTAIRELATQLSVLSKIARTNKIPVIITNQVYENPKTGRLEMSGSSIVKWWSKNIIELFHVGKPGRRLAVIKKARSLPEERGVEFEIYSKGIRDYKG
ncbi:MAG: DNA repair and recombination protein RadB [Candidatus Aenigmarchaeota archaeon]|nr:DNA repair and recombination protein RadB [Candidatus Aenigmarchaeota archaeon]